MPFIHGKGTELLLDGNNLSGYFNAADFGADVDTAETSTFQNTWKSHLAGMAGATMDGSGFYDPNQTNLQATLQSATPNVLSLAPGGATALGDNVRLFKVTAKAYKESSKIGGAVAFNWSILSDAVVGFGQSFHPLAAETITGTSAFIDGLAQSLTGAIATLHVTALAGTSPTVTVKFSDCATSGGSYVDITGGSFTLANAVGAQRLVIPGTIRQFVKCTWTVTGSGGQTLTFAVAFART